MRKTKSVTKKKKKGKTENHKILNCSIQTLKIQKFYLIIVIFRSFVFAHFIQISFETNFTKQNDNIFLFIIFNTKVYCHILFVCVSVCVFQIQTKNKSRL